MLTTNTLTDIDPETWYIAGPMRGYEEYNYPAFRRAKAFLESLGVEEIFSPHEHDATLGLTPDEAGAVAELDIGLLLRDDFAVVAQGGHILMLPGWEASDGARKELQVALWSASRIYFHRPDEDEPIEEIEKQTAQAMLDVAWGRVPICGED